MNFKKNSGLQNRNRKFYALCKPKRFPGYTIWNWKFYGLCYVNRKNSGLCHVSRKHSSIHLIQNYPRIPLYATNFRIIPFPKWKFCSEIMETLLQKPSDLLNLFQKSSLTYSFGSSPSPPLPTTLSQFALRITIYLLLNQQRKY